AMRRHFPVPGINPRHDLAGKLPADAFEPGGVLQRLSAKHYPLDAPAERQGNVGFRPQAASQLTRYTSRRHDGADAITVDRPTFAGTIEVYQMQEFRAVAHPAPRHGSRIIAEDGFLGIIPLHQPHTFSAAQVNGREDEHGLTLSRATQGENGSL